MEEQNTVKQTENFGEVVGLLKKKKINFKQSEKTKNFYANGSIEVEVTNEFGTNVIKIDVMQMALKKNGEENKNYKALQTINNEYKTIDDDGRENADLVQVFVRVEENNYYLQEEDEVRQGTKLMACTDFDKKIFAPIKRVKEKTTEHKARISFEGKITKITPIENTGELKVEIVGADYNGQAVKHTLDVSKDLAQSFMGMYQVGAVTTLHYLVVNAVEVKEIKQEVAFGSAPSYTIENYTRKNLVCGGNAVNYASEFTDEVLNKLLKMREVRLEEVKTEALNKANNTSQSAPQTPFGAGAGVGAGAPTNSPFGGGAGAPQFGAGAGVGGASPFGAGAPTSSPFGG